jgi:RHS repeat-associated protein
MAGTLIAMSVNATLKYVHKDHLGGTSVVTSDNGTLIESLKYYSFGETRSLTGPDVTDKLFTGQILDDTGLYYYGARYYDPTIGRFISPDTVIPNPANPQSLNRYSYCLNNPLKYTDPSGQTIEDEGYSINGVNSNNIEEYLFSNQALGIYLDPEILVAVAILNDIFPQFVDMFEDSSNIYNIHWGDNVPSQNMGRSDDGKDIELNKNNCKSSIDVAATVAHEFVHSYRITMMDIGLYTTDSKFEEALADKMSDTVYKQCHYIPWGPFSTISRISDRIASDCLNTYSNLLGISLWCWSFQAGYAGLSTYPQSLNIKEYTWYNNYGAMYALLNVCGVKLRS